MRVLVTGGSGVLGGSLVRLLRGQWAVRGLDRNACDVTESFTVQRVFRQLQPDVVLHCASLSRVGACELRPDLAYRINAQGAANVAAACQRLGARLIAFSTAAVFDGSLERAYHERDTPNPKTALGRSKLAAEQLIRSQCDDHLILRLSWLYGPSRTRFSVRVLDEAAQVGAPLRVIADQYGCPTSADAVSRFVETILRRPDSQGVWHLASVGEASWYEVAQAVAAGTGSTRTIVPCQARDYPRPMRHPDNVRLANGELLQSGLENPPHWRDDLNDFLARGVRRAAA